MSITEQQLGSVIKLLDEAKLLPDGASAANLDKACEKWLVSYRLKDEPTPDDTDMATLLTLLRASLQKTARATGHRPFKRRKRT